MSEDEAKALDDLQAIKIWWPREIPVPQFVGELGARKVTAWPAGFSMEDRPAAFEPVTSPHPDKYRAALAGGRITLADIEARRFSMDEIAAYGPWERTADGLAMVSRRGSPEFERERRLQTEMRPRPADWKPDLRSHGAYERWCPPAGSKCRSLGYVRTAEPSLNARLLNALLDSAWQSLEHERILGEPPPIRQPQDVRITNPLEQLSTET